MTSVDWLGGGISDRITEAVAEAIDETTTAAAEQAATTTLDLPFHEAAGYYWFGLTPRIESTVTNEPAQVKGDVVSGRFGTTERRGDYGHFLERVQPFLRPAADAEFPNLADRIRSRLE